MSSLLELCALCVLLLGSVSRAGEQKVPVPKELPSEAVADEGVPRHSDRATTEAKRTPSSKTLAVSPGHDNNPRRGRARFKDPFGGCRLTCPTGFNVENYHFHMHKMHRPVVRGGRDPIHGIWHHDWKERAH